MPSAPHTPNEPQRLATLRALEILDTPPEPAFDRLTRLAQRFFRVPIAGISLLDEDRQWFKSVQGIDLKQTPRCGAFCAHTILSSNLTIVRDAREDPRVCDSPLVNGPPSCRFYAGAPIFAANHQPLGAFFLIDTEPRQWDPANDQPLWDFAACASEAIDARLHARRAAAALHAKRLFAANMSHEIRTPLNVILGNADLLRHKQLDRAQKRVALETIARNSNHLAEVSDAILNFAALDAGSLDFRFEDFDAAQVLEQLRPLVARSAAQRGLHLDLRWCGSRNVRLHSDPARIRQVILHLITNAIRFTSSGSVTAIGFLAASLEDRPRLHFIVSDTGPGFMPEQYVSLLEPFSQGDNSPTRAHGGLGLGLTIADAVVKSLGGTLALRSRPGSGSTFEIAVPCSPAAAPASASFAPNLVLPSDRPLAGRDILLAEDCVDTQRLTSLILRKAGANVQVVGNGAAAVAAVQNRGAPFDAILMDMQMPVMGGCDATIRIRCSGYTAPILALTANATAKDREDCLAAGCDDFLTKPIPRASLVSRLAELPHAAPLAAAA